MNEKFENIRLNYKIWLETEGQEGILGDRKCEVLRAIDETGSLNDAMKKLNLTYRKTWDNLKKIEQELGFTLLRTTRGGAEGGHTELTREARIIVRAFEQFHAGYDSIIREGFEKILSDLKAEIQ